MASRRPQVARKDGSNNSAIWILLGVAVLLTVAIGLLVTSGSLFDSEPQSDAERDYQMLLEGLKQNPDDPAVLMTLAEVELDLGKRADAFKHAERAIEVGGEQEGLQLRYAQLLIRDDRLDEARDALLLELENDAGEQNAEVFFIIAQVESETGNHEQAIDYIERGLELAPVAADMRVVYGRILEKAGETEKAIEQYQEALRFLPDNQDAQEGLQRLGVEYEEPTSAVMPGTAPDADAE